MHPRCASCSAQPTEQGVTEADRKADGTAAARSGLAWQVRACADLGRRRHAARARSRAGSPPPGHLLATEWAAALRCVCPGAAQTRSYSGRQAGLRGRPDAGVVTVADARWQLAMPVFVGLASLV